MANELILFIKKNGFHNNYILSLINIFTPVLITPYIVRIIGFEHYGQLALYTSYQLIFNLFIDFGFNINGPKKVAEKYSKNLDLSLTFSLITITKLLIFLILLTGVLIFIYFNKLLTIDSLFLTSILIVFSNLLNPYWFFNGIGDLKLYTFLSIISKLLVVFLVFFFVRIKQDYMIVQIVFFVTNMFLSILATIILLNKYKIKLSIPKFKLFLITINNGKFVFFSNVVNGLYTNLPIIFMGTSFNVLQVGYFSSAEKLIKIFQNIFSPFFQSIFPMYIKWFNGSKNENVKIKTLLILVFLFSSIVSIVLFIWARPIVYLFYKSIDDGHVKIFRLMCFLPFTYVLNNIFGMFMLSTTKSQIIYSVVFSLITCLFLLLFYLLSFSVKLNLIPLIILFAEASLIISFIYFSTKLGLNIFIND
jgi:PST family polysaccharide transporter